MQEYQELLALTHSTYVIHAWHPGCCLNICLLVAFGIIMNYPYDHYIDINCILPSVWQLEGLVDQTEAWHYEVIWWYYLLSSSFPFRAIWRVSDCYIFYMLFFIIIESLSSRDPYGRKLQTQKRFRIYITDICACRKLFSYCNVTMLNLRSKAYRTY